MIKKFKNKKRTSIEALLLNNTNLNSDPPDVSGCATGLRYCPTMIEKFKNKKRTSIEALLLNNTNLNSDPPDVSGYATGLRYIPKYVSSI